MTEYPFRLEFIIETSSLEAKNHLMTILEPEIKSQQFERSKVTMISGDELEPSFKIQIQSKDRASLLANVGTFLRWFEFIDRLEKEIRKTKE